MHERTTRVYRVKAVAEMFDVSVATIYRAIETGQLSALKLGRGRGTLRVPEGALQAFARACGRPTSDRQHSQAASSDRGHSQRRTPGATGGGPS